MRSGHLGSPHTYGLALALTRCEQDSIEPCICPRSRVSRRHQIEIQHQAVTNKKPSSLVAIGIVRITTVYNINYKDFSYSGTTASNWAFAESGIAIMTVCGPMLRPLLDRLMPKSFISSRNTISQEKRKRYGQLQDHQVELVPRTVERSRALISAAADVRPHSEIDDDLRNGGVVEGREWYPRDGDVESGIHVQHCVTVES